MSERDRDQRDDEQERDRPQALLDEVVDDAGAGGSWRHLALGVAVWRRRTVAAPARAAASGRSAT